CRDSCRNPPILFSSALAADTLLKSELFGELHAQNGPPAKRPQFMLSGTYSTNQLRACPSSLGGKNFTGARRTPAPAKASARGSQRGSATMAILEILPPCEIRKSRSFQSAPRSQPSKLSRITSKRGFDPMSILRARAL